MIVYKSNGSKVGDGKRITRVSGGGTVFEVWTGSAYSEVELKPDPPPPDPIPDPDPVPGPDPAPAPPVIGGTVAISASDLAAKAAALGPGNHVIGMANGHHDALRLTGVNTGGTVTIVPENQGGATFDRIRVVKGCAGIMFDGINGMPKAPVPKSSLGTGMRAHLFVAEPGTNLITFRNGHVAGRSDAADCMDWAAADWLDWYIGGVQVRGTNCAIVNMTGAGLNFGFEAAEGARGGLIEDCRGLGFSGDAIRVNDDDVTVRRNRMTDFVQVDANHCDGLQAFGRYANGVYDRLDNMIVEDNVFLEWTVKQFYDLRINPGPGMAKYGVLQGIGLHNGPYLNATIRRNVIGTAHANGIKISGGTDTALDDNLCFNIDHGSANFDARFPRIDVTGTVKSMTGNQAHEFRNAATGTVPTYPVTI